MFLHAPLNRRAWLSGAATAAVTASVSPWLGQIAALAAAEPRRHRSCILLWMAGGPSQLDTLDPKPGTANGGPFAAIGTATPGIQICEHLPQLARQMPDLALIRSMQTKEGDHGRATSHLRTGYRAEASIRFPSLGALVSQELADRQADLPGFVSIAPQGAYAQPAVSAGFLGAPHAPLVVSAEGETARDAELRVKDLSPAVAGERWQERYLLLREMEQPFLASRPGPGASSHVTAYDRAARLRGPAAIQAFDLQEESGALRDKYGRSSFGQGCLLARRLVERGVPFVEVTLGGWDTHNNNFEQVQSLCNVLDPAWATLLADLKDRQLLDDTLVVWMGEFGRTPAINPRVGRDHFPPAWSVALGGGGIRGGQVVGSTNEQGTAVVERPVQVADLMATICTALKLDPTKQNISNVARPIRLADPTGKAIAEVLS